MQQSDCHILFIDDNADTCHLVSIILESDGYKVTCAYSFADGIRLARGGDFDLYLLDSKLPDGTGVELCRQIREFAPDRPILFFSADAYEASRQKAIAAGAQGYLTKPIDPRLLEQSVTRLLGDSCSSNPI